MKKMLLLAGLMVSYYFSAQASGSLFIQNYTKNNIGYVISKLNLGNTAGNCTPNLEARSSTNDLITLPYTLDPNVPVEANYESNLNLGFAPHPVYTSTPLIGRVIINGNYNPPFILSPTAPIVPFSAASTWSHIKFGVTDMSGTAIGGYYSMGQGCGATSVISDLSGYTNPAVNGLFFTMGGATWVVLY